MTRGTVFLCKLYYQPCRTTGLLSIPRCAEPAAHPPSVCLTSDSCPSFSPTSLTYHPSHKSTLVSYTLNRVAAVISGLWELRVYSCVFMAACSVSQGSPAPEECGNPDCQAAMQLLVQEHFTVYREFHIHGLRLASQSPLKTDTKQWVLLPF